MHFCLIIKCFFAFQNDFLYNKKEDNYFLKKHYYAESYSGASCR